MSRESKESTKKPNNPPPQKKKRRGRKKQRRDWCKQKNETGETFAGSHSVSHNLLGVGYERVQFCSGYHYHHGYNHNQGNSSVARWKGGWQRVMEEDKMSDRRNKDITGCNHGEMHRGSETV